MTAKHKLNSAHIIGAVLFAGSLGLVTQSWLVFLIAMAVLIAGAIHDGSLRL